MQQFTCILLKSDEFFSTQISFSTIVQVNSCYVN